MKNKLLGLLLLSAFLLTGCISMVNGFVKDAIVLNEYLEEKATEGFSKDEDNFVKTSDEKIDFTVWGFSEECVVLNWKAERTGVRYKIYVKDTRKFAVLKIITEKQIILWQVIVNLLMQLGSFWMIKKFTEQTLFIQTWKMERDSLFMPKLQTTVI